MGRGLRRAGATGSRVARRVGSGTAHAASSTYHLARRASRAEGAGESGLFRLIEMNAVSAAGDAAVAISLAGTLFFQVPTAQARGQVALFLGLTLLPFAVVAPLIGPFLDRYGHGRRWAIGSTTALRAFLCWVLAGAVSTQDPIMFPAALGCLVSSKAYGITKAAAVPRLLPPGLTLVKTNARISLAGVLGVAIASPIVVLVAQVGPEWSLRLGFVLFAFATVLAVLLPGQVDQRRGERGLEADESHHPDAQAPPTSGPAGTSGAHASHATSADPGATQPLTQPQTQPLSGPLPGVPPEAYANREHERSRPLRRRALSRWIRPVPGPVVMGLRSNSGLRLLSGFLTLYLAFLLREIPVPGWPYSPQVLVGLVIAVAGAGNSIGIALGSILRRVRPEIGVIVTLGVDIVVATAAAIWFAAPVIVLLGLCAGVCQGFAKLCLDALIQRDVAEQVRASTFARSETLLQLSWVVGGFVGISMPLVPHAGLGVAVAILVACAVWTISASRRNRRRRPAVVGSEATHSPMSSGGPTT